MKSDDRARSVRRVEDFRFLTGGGRYVEDFVRPAQIHAHVLRSPHAHAAIERRYLRGTTEIASVLMRKPQENLSKTRTEPTSPTLASYGAGIGLRLPHVAEIAAARPHLGFIEVHAENYMAETAAVDRLLELRSDYPVSIHGVALSLGSAEQLDRNHLCRLRALIERVEPVLVSEHLAWSAIGGAYLNDLLPLPYTEESLDVFCRHVGEAQETLGARLLIENPSSYLRFRHSTIPEAEFLTETARRTGCGILCDVNNIYVSATNFRFDPIAYLEALPAAAIGEIHLAGHHAAEDVDVLIDNHGSRVAQPVWELYAQALRRFGALPTLIEWDTKLPALEILLDEARHAQELADVYRNAEFA